ncbi:hypothetical protein [Pseudomonas sp. RIT-PI-S]|uniref:hypothetical protein n=1 Tax=Pseudomonas sp. RIT-PI-S TaxID=3035295 RepID=UPI0021D93389|nr:hypothetical protein [Pseudomonas sp. RIT-PI-S]
MNTRIPFDYRSALHRMALAFLEDHQAAHLSGDQALFSRTVAHLRHEHGVDEALAQLTASRAYGEFRSAGERRHLDVANSSRSVAVLTDPSSGLTYAVPVAVIFRLIIDAPERRRLRAVY